MKINKTEALIVLNEIIREGQEDYLNKDITEVSLKQWNYQLGQAMDRVFSSGSSEHELMDQHAATLLLLAAMTSGKYSTSQAYAKYGNGQVRDQVCSLKKVVSNIEANKITQFRPENIENDADLTMDSVLYLERICLNFHAIQKQLRKRHDNRPTLIVENEYDTQDLFHSLLHLYFDDIRPEDSVPSQAGSNSRVDFLLKREKIVIEIKKTRKNLTDKKLGEELIIDIDRYRPHQNCKFLFCFVYDPEGFIRNPRGLEDDLKRAEGNFGVRVMIVSS